MKPIKKSPPSPAKKVPDIDDLDVELLDDDIDPGAVKAKTDDDEEEDETPVEQEVAVVLNGGIPDKEEDEDEEPKPKIDESEEEDLDDLKKLERDAERLRIEEMGGDGDEETPEEETL